MEGPNAATLWKTNVTERFLGRHWSTALLVSIFMLSCWSLGKVRIELLTPLFKHTSSSGIWNLEFIISAATSTWRLGYKLWAAEVCCLKNQEKMWQWNCSFSTCCSISVLLKRFFKIGGFFSLLHGKLWKLFMIKRLS